MFQYWAGPLNSHLRVGWPHLFLFSFWHPVSSSLLQASKRISKQNIRNILFRFPAGLTVCSWPDKDIRHDVGSVGTLWITRVLPLLVFFCWHLEDQRVVPLLVSLTAVRVSARPVLRSAPLVRPSPPYMHSISLENRWRVQINSRWQNFSEELWGQVL